MVAVTTAIAIVFPEKLSEVETVFVHLDYETRHKPEYYRRYAMFI